MRQGRTKKFLEVRARDEHSAQNRAETDSADLFSFLLEIDFGGGLNCAQVHGNDFFCRSTVHSVKFGQMHAAVIIMATDNHVPQFPDGGVRMIFGK